MIDDLNTSLFSRPPHGHRVLICVKGNCAHPDLGQALHQKMLKLIRQHGLDDPHHPHYTTCKIVQCLGVCAGGPIMMIHPEAIRYHQVDEAALERIVREHLLQSRPVEDLMRPPLSSSPHLDPAKKKGKQNRQR